MPTPDSDLGALAALSEKEREVLQMLTAGHTVKSIAVRLGRSETSINERLRDARRKTGIGSSRELARILDAQKTWDKNIDLSASGTVAYAAVQPLKTGRIWPKGTMIMLMTIPLAAAGLIMATNSINQGSPPQAEHVAASAEVTLIGRWSLDVSRVPSEERPRQVTIDFHISRDQMWTTFVEIIDANGRKTEAKSIAAIDGTPVPILGNMEFIDAMSLRQPAPNSLVMTLAKNGVPISTRVYTVANDRKSMTETIVWPGNNMPKLETNHFRRVE